MTIASECDCGARLLARGGKSKDADSVNGSPEQIIDDGVVYGSHVTGRWVELISYALEGKDTVTEIMAAVSRAMPEARATELVPSVHEALGHGVMLGAMDSAYETVTNNTIEAPAFEEPESIAARARAGAPLIVLVEGVAAGVAGFDAMPYGSAVAKFLELKPVTPKVWARLSDLARAKAFQVAGMARKSMLTVVQKELARQVQRGADLRDFRKFAEERLVSNGWTPASPSHVETIFRTNVQKAYSAGRLEHMMRPSVLKLRPFWQIVGVGDGPPRERPWHAKHNNAVMRADNPNWRGKIPPWGFNCRHRVRSIPANYDGPVESDLADVPDKGFRSTVEGLLG